MEDQRAGEEETESESGRGGEASDNDAGKPPHTRHRVSRVTLLQFRLQMGGRWGQQVWELASAPVLE